MSTAISNRPVPVSVEVDGRNGRETRDFDDAHDAKRFYVAKERAGKNPKVTKGDLPAASEPDEPKASKGNKAKPSKQTKDAEPKPKKEVPRDALGCRKGSQAAKINAALNGTPKQAAAIADSTKLGAARVRAHLKFLVGKGFVVETKDGFKLKGK